jgi:hypothetical protein
MMIVMGTISLLCGMYSVGSAIKSFATGKTEDLDEFPPIKRKKNPVKFHMYTFACLVGGIAMIACGVLILLVSLTR